MFKLENVKFSHKLVLLVVMPLIGMLWFSQAKLFESWSQYGNAKDLVSLTELSVSVSDLVHELQKERGLSAGYLGSGGKKFSAKLNSHYNNTDQKMEALLSHVETMTVGELGERRYAELHKSLLGLEAIKSTRQKIQSLNLPVSRAVAFYSGLNTDFLTLIGHIATSEQASEQGNQLASYYSFLESKERAGIERALLTRTFAQDAFGDGFGQKFIGLVSAQDAYMRAFMTIATEEAKASYHQTMKGNAISETERMRKVASNRLNQGGFNIDSGYWFSQQTEKINLLKRVETDIAGQLVTAANVVAANARNSMIFNLILTLVILSLTSIFGIALVRHTLANLGTDPSELTRVVSRIAELRLDHEFTSVSELTGIYAAAEKMQNQLRDYIEENERKLVTTTRIQKALDRASTCFTITDRSRTISYVNPSADELFRSLQADIRGKIDSFRSDDICNYSVRDFLVFAESGQNLDLNTSAQQKFKLEVGESIIELSVNPVLSDDGEFWGSVVEWVDRTQEIISQEDIKHVVEGAMNGDLDQRADASKLDGYYRVLAESVNSLVENFQLVIKDTGRVMTGLSVGELTQKIETNYKGEFESLKQAANSTIDKLTEVVEDIKSVSGQVRSGAQEISEGNLNLSHRTEDQASSLEETASSMEEMTSTVKQNADNASEANRLAIETRQQAEAGGEVVSKAVAAMDAIDDSSKKISDIIGVIDEIAFQTNLLALNASVEAARAGEQGRGFAVVASEVRNLAGRSATAAKEIKDLIEDSGAKVNEGSRLVNESGKTLQEIIGGVKKVTDIVGEIASASQEQSAGISEVNIAIATMDDLTQQNAALVEEAAAASETLGSQANGLNNMMAFFTTCNSAAQNTMLKSAVPAAVPAAKDVPAEEVKRTERRKADRPWSESAKPQQADSSDAVQPITAESGKVGNGESWDEF